MTPMSLVDIAKSWLSAFEHEDLDALLALYAEDCVHTSPKIRAQHPETGGRLVGKAALRTWWAKAFSGIPGLSYEPLAFTADGERVFMEYIRHADGQPDLPVAEVLEVSDGKIVSSRVYHG